MSDSFSSHTYLLLRDKAQRASQRWDMFISSSVEESSALYPTELKGDQFSWYRELHKGWMDAAQLRQY